MRSSFKVEFLLLKGGEIQSDGRKLLAYLVLNEQENNLLLQSAEHSLGLLEMG